MRTSVRPLAFVTALVLLAGCSSMRTHSTACKIGSFLLGGTVGAVGGGVGVDQIEPTPDDGERAAGAAAGFVAGGLVGMVLGQLLCPGEPAAAPEPPPPPPPAPPARGEKIGEIAGPHFAFDQARLTPAGSARVADAARLLAAHPDVRVAVEGHTDSVGNPEYNQRLSERRARVVADRLIAEGVAPRRLDVRGFGESRPVADNDTEEGRARNRRVEIVVQ
jgi:OOP family OmpA-OmpF porin